ncbi:acyltransferase [Tessaracoccus sp. HDW20]|uniref:acyltransferase n=1 Tax=Tessaracoccus coleopterorum TaxID=2714950 RepID=UPI0018D47AD0|nr:acyltransferase [Tessaracoccus coleopterorum]NHB84058.1 acyltransferase [Tessaracoccus coleopterorum]
MPQPPARCPPRRAPHHRRRAGHRVPPERPYTGLGFAGVDVFLVLSGYLVTAGLLRDTQRLGRPRFARFWQRSFKWLLPAATLVLLGVPIYATVFMPLFRRTAAASDVAWTAIYLGNWHFMKRGPGNSREPRAIGRLSSSGRRPSQRRGARRHRPS